MTDIENIVAGLARAHRVPAAHVHAVIEVESGGQAFTVVRDRFGGSVNFPLCRFEGHLFYKNLSGAKRDQAVKAGLASPKIEKRGGVRNPKTQQGRYDLLQRAREIDPDAAVAACSWGVGQVLGSHWKRFGLSSPQDVYAKAGTLAGQLELMFDYIEAFGLMDELHDGEWASFARLYNGKAYRTNKYDTKLAAAAVRHGASLPPRDGMLRMGAKGPKVKEVQALLNRAPGFSLKVDGDFGPTTRAAVQRFQRAAKVEVDGVVGPETFALLQNFLQGDREDLQKPGLADVLQIPNIGKVVTGVAGGGAVVLTDAKQSVEQLAAQAGDLAGQVAGIPTLASYVTMAASGLVTFAAVLGVAAAGYAAWQWLKSHRTYEGVPA